MSVFNMNYILNQYRTHWQWYREFFSVAILRYFVVWFSIVPIALHVLDSVPAIIHVASWQVDIRPSLPFNWAVLWFASLAYTAALIIYAARCPDFIKKNPSFAQYKSFGHSPRWLVWLTFDVLKVDGDPWGKLFDRLQAKKYLDIVQSASDFSSEPKVLDKGTVLTFERDNVQYEFVMPRRDTQETEIAEREIFWEIFGAHSGSRKYSRLSIIVLLIIALILFVYVLLQHIIKALPEALGAL